jgi:4-hydroxybenzoate polyprenyltransferase
MVHQANFLLDLNYDHVDYYLFVFFATTSSYNFHWLLTTESHVDSVRLQWTRENRHWHVIYFLAGLIGAIGFGIKFLEWWIWLGLAGVLTFLYSAPKIPFALFQKLRKIAYGKTIFLSGVWTYVTTVLPAIFDWQKENDKWLFIISRFFLIYAICIIFDLRDRDSDKKEGLKSLITILSIKNVSKLFYFSLAVAGIAVMLTGFSIPEKMILLLPVVVTGVLYEYSRKNYSDYLYYVVLDGLMMLSSLITLFMAF